MTGDEKRDFSINNKIIELKINKEYGTAKVNDIFFPCKEDFIYFVNKLTDAAEDLNEET